MTRCWLAVASVEHGRAEGFMQVNQGKGATYKPETGRQP